MVTVYLNPRAMILNLLSMKNTICISLLFWLIACSNNVNNDNNSDTLIVEEREEAELIEETESIVIKINESDSLALLALYNYTNGKNWKNKVGLIPIRKAIGIL